MGVCNQYLAFGVACSADIPEVWLQYISGGFQGIEFYYLIIPLVLLYPGVFVLFLVEGNKIPRPAPARGWVQVSRYASRCFSLPPFPCEQTKKQASKQPPSAPPRARYNLQIRSPQSGQRSGNDPWHGATWKADLGYVCMYIRLSMLWYEMSMFEKAKRTNWVMRVEAYTIEGFFCSRGFFVPAL